MSRVAIRFASTQGLTQLVLRLLAGDLPAAGATVVSDDEIAFDAGDLGPAPFTVDAGRLFSVASGATGEKRLIHADAMGSLLSVTLTNGGTITVGPGATPGTFSARVNVGGYDQTATVSVVGSDATFFRFAAYLSAADNAGVLAIHDGGGLHDSDSIDLTGYSGGTVETITFLGGASRSPETTIAAENIGIVGTIRVTPTGQAEVVVDATKPVIIIAADPLDAARVAAFLGTVPAASDAPAINTTTLAAALALTVDTASDINLAAAVSGGLTPRVYAIAGLPSGMADDGDGTASGTPLAVGEVSTTLTAIDARGVETSATVTASVTGIPIPKSEIAVGEFDAGSVPVTVSSIPAADPAITGIEYSTDGETWVALPEPVVSGAADLSYFGGEIVFTATGGTSGQYADGSWWTTGDVTAISPAFATGVTRTLADTSTVENTEVHGFRVNPGASPSGATLAEKQAVNHGVTTEQCYDSLVIGTNAAYGDALRPSLPITAGSVVKAKSRLTGVRTDGRPVLEYLAVCTVVSSAPAAGSLRPPLARADKTPVLNTADIDLTKLSNLDATGYAVPSYADALAWVSALHTFENTFNVNSRNIVGPNGADEADVTYFGDMADLLSQVLLAMHFDAWTSEQKTQIAIRLGLWAQDIAARVNEGGIFQDAGGQAHGRLPVLAFCAELFGSTYLSDACAVLVEGTMDSGIASPIGASVFGDVSQIRLVTQADIDAGAPAIEGAVTIPAFPQAMLGWPTWTTDGTRYGRLNFNLLGHIAARPSPYAIAEDGASYQHIAAKSYPGAYLALRLIGAETLVPQRVLDYTDRFMGWWADGTDARYALPQPNADARPVTANSPPAWVAQAWAAHRGAGTWPNAPVVVGVMGQSELEYLMNPASFYNQIAKPTLPAENLIAYTEATQGSGIAKTVVTQAAVDAGQVNPAMAAWSVWLHRVAPGQQFVIADLAVAGTSRYELMDDAETDRTWTAFQAMIDAVRGDGYEFDAIVECWYNSDASSIATFGQSFAPFYMGQRWGGEAFTLGNTNPDAVNATAVVDHCLWDVEATPNAKGRGVFTRDRTKLHVVLPMPFADAPVDPATEWTNYSGTNPRLGEPDRAAMETFVADSRVQTFLGSLGPSAHITDFGGGIHPVVDNPDGQVLLGWPLAAAVAREAGVTIHEPLIESVEVASDGSYADVVVDLPNGGTLTTLRALRSAAAPGTEPPHYQAVVGFEIDRGGTRRPVYKTTETTYPAAHRGAVTIQDSGSGTPRKGRVRITPEEPFATGDGISYLRGQASALLVEPRDVDAKLYLNMLVEHVPALYTAGDIYSFEGVAVRPYQADLAISSVSATAPAQMSAPTVTATGETSISVDRAAAPSDGGSAITSYDLRWSTDEATWTTVTGIADPQAVSSLTADTLYYVQTRAVNAIGAGAWSTSGTATTDAAAAAFWTQGAGGPYFVDPANVPASTTRIEFEGKFRLSAQPGVVVNWFTQESTGCDLWSDIVNRWRVSIEDGDGTAPAGTGISTGVNLPANDIWFTARLDVDMAAGTASLEIDNVEVWSTTFTASPATFQSSREISFLGNTSGGGIVPSGTAVEYVRAYFTTSGVRTLRKEIAGAAATVNADPWKRGGDAT